MSGPPGEHCVLCGTKTIGLGSVGENHRLWECEICGMAHIRPLPPEGDDAHQSVDVGAYASAVNPLRDGFLYHHRKLLELLIRPLKNPGRLLEVGCNQGEFLKVAQSIGFDVMGSNRLGGPRGWRKFPS